LPGVDGETPYYISPSIRWPPGPCR